MAGTSATTANRRIPGVVRSYPAATTRQDVSAAFASTAKRSRMRPMGRTTSKTYQRQQKGGLYNEERCKNHGAVLSADRGR